MSAEAFDRDALIRYRLEQARTTLRDAQLLAAGEGSPHSIVNRAYYAMFYAAQALLLSHGIQVAKHSGALALFDQQFVKPGLLPKEMSKALHRAFEWRQIGDYRVWHFTNEQALEILQQAEAFVQTVHAYLAQQ